MHQHQIAYLITLQCQKCNREGQKLILAVQGTPFKAGCVVCQRCLSVRAERYFVYAGFLVIRVKEYV